MKIRNAFSLLVCALAALAPPSQAQIEMLPPPPDAAHANPVSIQPPFGPPSIHQPSMLTPSAPFSQPPGFLPYAMPRLAPEPPAATGPVRQPVEENATTTDMLAVELTTEEDPPFQPVWYNPLSWIGPWWNGSVSLGINGSEGNANAFNIRSGFELSRETERANWDLDLTYNKASADEVETAHNALLQSNWDYKLRNPRWTWFNKLGLEYDEFKNFDVRLFINSGAGYAFVDNEITQFRGRFGSGMSREFGGIDDDWKPEAVFGFDFARQMTERQRFVATVDYYPTWEDFTDYRLVADLGWEIDLDAPTNLSLKFGVIDRYDSTPNGALANDVDYSVLLIWTL